MKKFNMTLTLALLSIIAFAQEKVDANIDLNINKGTDVSGGGFPWLWIVGAVVLIAVLFAVFSGRNNTTIIKD